MTDEHHATSFAGVSDAEARRFLLDAGVPEDEIAVAAEQGRLHLLVYERLVLPAEAKYTEAEVADLTGMDVELNRRFWRALGFPDPGPDDRIFTDADLNAITAVHGMLALGIAEAPVALQLARVVGSSMARIADAQVESASGLASHDSDRAAELYALTAGGMFDGFARLLEYVWRRHLLASVRHANLRRAAVGDAGGRVATVGFADLVGFTALSQQLSDAALAAVVSRFEELAYDTVAAGGGRVAKMIGDEVMFVIDDVGRGVRIALELAETYAEEEELSNVRVGLACGNVLVREADYYGPVVNLASRIVGIARPATVVVSDAVHDELAGDPELAWRPLRSRYLKDIGRVSLWMVSHATPRPVSSDEDEEPEGEESPLAEARRQGRRVMRTLLGEAARQRMEDRLRPGAGPDAPSR